MNDDDFARNALFDDCVRSRSSKKNEQHSQRIFVTVNDAATPLLVARNALSRHLNTRRAHVVVGAKVKYTLVNA